LYHPLVVERRLDEFEAAYGWRPIRYSEEVIQHNIEHLESLINEEGELTRPYTAEEQQFQDNERAMCFASARHYLENYCKIEHWAGGLVRFKMNFAQEIIFSIISDLELKGVAISLQVLKARQLGITTLAEALIAHRIQFVAEAWGIVGSNDEDKSTRMVAKAELVWLNMPRWLMPQLTVRRAGERIVFGGQLSGLSISHGSAQSGIGRGSTLQCAHLSEVAEYKNAKDLIDDSLLRAMHESPSIFQIFESTAHGVGGWWHDTWEVNKRLYHKGQGKMYPVFLPWYAGKDLYPTKGWMRARPIPADWVPGALTQAHATKAAAYVRNSPLLSKWLGKDWKMPRAQMWFWEVERALAAEKDNLAGFYQEMPADDAEAFQSSGYSVFNTELIAEKREQAKRPLSLFGVAGPSYEIPLSMQPDRRDVNRNMPGIDIKANWHPRQKPKEYHLVPLKMDNYPNIDWDKKLMVWEFPEPDVWDWCGHRVWCWR
jgi:hypothetical protein